MRFLALRTSYCSWFDKRIAGQPQDELFSHSLDRDVHSPCSLLAKTDERQKKSIPFSIFACHPCAGAMLIFSVSFQF